MTYRDLPRIAELEREIFSSPWSEESLRAELSNPHARYVVLEVDSEIIAYAGCWIICDEAHLNNVAVAPHHRGRGLGERIVRFLAGSVWTEGAHSMTLEVRASNLVARSLYEKLGFVQRGTRRRYYTDNQEDAVIMWLDDISPLAEDSLW